MTVVASAKAKLVGKDSVLEPLPGLEGVKFSYSPPRDVLREVVYGGQVAGPVELKAMAGGGRIKRSESLNLLLYVRVWKPSSPNGAQGATAEKVEARAAAIGDVIALYVAANPTLGDLADLKLAQVSALDLDSWVDDDGAGAVLTMTVGLMSYLT